MKKALFIEILNLIKLILKHLIDYFKFSIDYSNKIKRKLQGFLF